MDQIILVLSLSQLYLKRKKHLCAKKRREVWVRDWLLKRKEKGCAENLLKELNLKMPELYNNFLRLSKANFDLLLDLVGPIIEKQNTIFREAIPPSERLMVTLRYLATGDSFMSLSYFFRISQPCITKIIPETCEAIFQSLKDQHLKVLFEISVDFIRIFI